MPPTRRSKRKLSDDNEAITKLMRLAKEYKRADTELEGQGNEISQTLTVYNTLNKATSYVNHDTVDVSRQGINAGVTLSNLLRYVEQLVKVRGYDIMDIRSIYFPILNG